MTFRIGLLVLPGLLAASLSFAQNSSSKLSPEERFFQTTAVASPNTTAVAGGKGGTPFKEVFPDGGILVGFDVWLGSWGTAETVVRAICPIYETLQGRHRGKVYGKKDGSPITVEANPGDAVSGINIRTGSVVDGLRVQFQKIDYYGFRLTGENSYKSEPLGGDGGSKRAYPITANGKPVIGIYGSSDVALDRLGFIVSNKH